ncbi:MAG: VanZ family protein [Alphaproteobacteria bacterium]
MTLPSRLVQKLVFLAAALAIGWASLAPQQSRPQTGFWDGWEHLAAYCVLGLAGLVAWPAVRHSLPVLAAIVLYGVLLEVLQGFLPGRMPGIGDAVANTVGAGLAYGIFWVCRRIAVIRKS